MPPDDDAEAVEPFPDVVADDVSEPVADVFADPAADVFVDTVVDVLTLSLDVIVVVVYGLLTDTVDAPV